MLRALNLNGVYGVCLQEDMLGKCDSMYNIKKAAAAVPLMVVTKVRKLDSCVAKPIFERGIFAGLLHLPKSKVSHWYCSIVQFSVYYYTFLIVLV